MSSRHRLFAIIAVWTSLVFVVLVPNADSKLWYMAGAWLFSFNVLCLLTSLGATALIVRARPAEDSQ